LVSYAALLLPTSLTADIDDARKQAKDYATQAKEMFERFVEEQRVTNTTIHAKIVAAQDEENEKLSQREQELEGERQRVADALMKMSREKAVFEVYHSRLFSLIRKLIPVV
jgi:uncharacterized HAD superfamily protein